MPALQARCRIPLHVLPAAKQLSVSSVAKLCGCGASDWGPHFSCAPPVIVPLTCDDDSPGAGAGLQVCLWYKDRVQRGHAQVLVLSCVGVAGAIQRTVTTCRQQRKGAWWEQRNE